MTTIRLYDKYPYETEFQATVIEAQLQEDGRLLVELDKTLFFPEAGGQTSDKGTLEGCAVLQVRIDHERITHELEGSFTQVPEQFTPGRIVRGSICFTERFSNMQNHSGEHILSGLMHRQYGFDNVGFHLSQGSVTLDVNGRLSEEELLQLELQANRVVWSNVPIRAEYPSEEVLKNTEYRSKKEIEGAIRLVTIEGVDVCACCAPHVRRTGEIGLIKILKVVYEKNKMRLFILCGRRALEEMDRKQKSVESISRLVSEPQESVTQGVIRLQEENGQLKYRMTGMAMKYMDLRTAALSGMKGDHFLFEEALDTGTLRRGVNALCEGNTGIHGIFSGSDEDGYFYILGKGQTEDGRDARSFNSLLLQKVSGKGGGKPEMVQGTIRSPREEIENALRELGR